MLSMNAKFCWVLGHALGAPEKGRPATRAYATTAKTNQLGTYGDKMIESGGYL